MEAYAAMEEAAYFVERYNEFAAELRVRGFSWFAEGWVGAVTEDGEVAALAPGAVVELLRAGPDFRLESQGSRPEPGLGFNLLETRQKLGAETEWTCTYCRYQGNELRGPDGRMWHVDHLFAQANGGDSMDDNLVLSCATCNLKKNRKLASDILYAQLGDRLPASEQNRRICGCIPLEEMREAGKL